MTVIKLTEPWATVRGKIGNRVLYPRGDRMIGRERVIPNNPLSAMQQSIRTFMTLASQQYNTITAQQALDWAALALLQTRIDENGDNYNPSGKGLYTGQNVYRQINAVALVDVAPANAIAAAALGVTSVDLDSAATVDLIFTHANADGFFFIEFTDTLSGTVKKAQDSDYRMANNTLDENVAARAVSPQTVSFTTANMHFTPAVGDRIGVRITSLSAGYLKGQVLTEEIVTIGV